jgi:hypothetical protein
MIGYLENEPIREDGLAISTFVVVPLARPGSFGQVDEVNPQVEVGGTNYLLVTQQPSAVRRSDMKARISDLPAETGLFINALDRLLTTC